MLKFSIIVPVYNTPKEYLQKCIDSIIAQSYSNWECVIVDDGSSMEYDTFTDSRIRYIKQSNSGVFAAYRNGFQHTTGDFIIHCDSDDWINTNYLQKIIDNFSDDNDTYLMRTVSVFEGGYQEYAPWANNGLQDYSNNEWFEALCSRKKTSWALWGVTLKRELLQKTYNELGNIDTIVPSYDCLVTVAYSVFANKVKFIPIDGFYYRINPNGVSFSTVTKAKLERTIDSEEKVLTNLQSLLQKHNIPSSKLDNIKHELGKNFVDAFYQCENYSEIYEQFKTNVQNIYDVELIKSSKSLFQTLLPKGSLMYRMVRATIVWIYGLKLNRQ